MRNRKPSYSIQAFTRSLCDLHLEPYRPLYRRQVSEAFDLYLRILRQVDERIATALSRDEPHWRLLNSCPPCHYKLHDEPPLSHDFLLTIDGGSSLKRFATAGSREGPQFQSDYFLSRVYVDGFANEVRSKKSEPQSKKKKKKPAQGDDADVEMEIDEEGQTPDVPGLGDVIMKAGRIDAAGSGDSANLISICVERWKANADDSKKGMFSCYDESGIFISACRHGCILVVADMVASGEL